MNSESTTRLPAEIIGTECRTLDEIAQELWDWAADLAAVFGGDSPLVARLRSYSKRLNAADDRIRESSRFWEEETRTAAEQGSKNVLNAVLAGSQIREAAED